MNPTRLYRFQMLGQNYLGNLRKSLNPVTRTLIDAPTIKNMQPIPPTYRETVSSGASAKLGQLAGFKEAQGLVTRVPLNDSVPDAHQIINILQNLAIQYGRTPYVREFVTSKVLCNIGNNDLIEMARQITLFTRANITYVADPEGSEYVMSPVLLIQRMLSGKPAFGDCDDHVLFLNSLLGSVGFQTRVIGVKLNSQTLYDHVISSVMIRGNWMDIDPCVKGGVMPSYTDRLIPSV